MRHMARRYLYMAPMILVSTSVPLLLIWVLNWVALTIVNKIYFLLLLLKKVKN